MDKMTNNKIIVSVVTAILIAAICYPYTEIFSLKDRVKSLEKDREYLPKIFEQRFISLERSVRRYNMEDRR